MTITMPRTGWLMASPEPAIEPGLWFVFHAGEDGVLAFDLTTPHEMLSYQPFLAALHREPDEAVVLKGGPEGGEDALTILRTGAARGPDIRPAGDDFAFCSYRYNLIPGHPPAIMTPDNAPTRISLQAHEPFLVIVGFRLWEPATFRQEAEAGLWTLLPATQDIVFRTPHRARRAAALNLVN